MDIALLLTGRLRKKGIPVRWSVAEYKELVKVAGGKERMNYYFNKNGWPPNYPDRTGLITDLHKLKTGIFMELISSGALPLRPGIARVIDEAIANHLKLAVCSTSNEKSVTLIIEKLLGEDRKKHINGIFAGDLVSHKKPDPEIYELCAEKLKIHPKNCLVIEDNRNGLLSAKAAGFNCLITTNEYSREEDFSEADFIVDELGDPPHIKISIEEMKQLVTDKKIR